MCCRLNSNSKNLDRTAENLARTAQVHLSGGTVRVLVENEGRQVLRLQNADTVAVGWSATDCQTEQGAQQDEPGSRQRPTRVYLGSDGVLVPMVTDLEKSSPRQGEAETPTAWQESQSARRRQSQRRSKVQGIQDRRLLR